jgi:hypothetical protein
MRAAYKILAFLLVGAGATIAQDNPAPAAEPSVMTLQTTTRRTAMDAANAWISDRSKHGQIYVHKLTINPDPNGKYTVHIEYTDTN